MAKKTREYYICDRCKEEIEESEICNVCDGFNAYNYYLCRDCYDIYEDYTKAIASIEKQYEQITNAYKFGKYMFREDRDDRKN